MTNSSLVPTPAEAKIVRKHVGFTGTRTRPSDAQYLNMLAWLMFLRKFRGFTTFHHGDCRGADEMAHYAAIEAGFTDIVVHPPEDDKHRARVWSVGFQTTLDPKPYLDRNKDIVDSSELLIACPKAPQVDRMMEYLFGRAKPIRSGTWSTVAHALRTYTNIVVIGEGIIAG